VGSVPTQTNGYDCGMLKGHRSSLVPDYTRSFDAIASTNHFCFAILHFHFLNLALVLSYHSHHLLQDFLSCCGVSHKAHAGVFMCLFAALCSINAPFNFRHVRAQHMLAALFFLTFLMCIPQLAASKTSPVHAGDIMSTCSLNID
jgi:hypothetical protein